MDAMQCVFPCTYYLAVNDAGPRLRKQRKMTLNIRIAAHELKNYQRRKKKKCRIHSDAFQFLET